MLSSLCRSVMSFSSWPPVQGKCPHLIRNIFMTIVTSHEKILPLKKVSEKVLPNETYISLIPFNELSGMSPSVTFHFHILLERL